MAASSRGRCLCGSVRFETDGGGIMGYCHCSICRKWSGAVFTTNLNAPSAGFRFVAGEDLIASYSAVEGSQRRHCRACGSIVPGGPVGGPWVAIGAGLLESDPGLRPCGHVFFGSRVPWLELADSLPRFEKWPPGFEPAWAKQDSQLDPGPATEWKPRASADGTARGSCLCGEVSYRVDPAAIRFVRCHCSRCRRATGSAYACNLIVLPEHFRWTSGRELVARYDLAEARSFANEFCRRCGSTLPHRTRSGREVIVPTGTLDDDPGLRVDGDVHLEDSVPWV